MADTDTAIEMGADLAAPSSSTADPPIPSFEPGVTGPLLSDDPNLFRCNNCKRKKLIADFIGTRKPITKVCHYCRTRVPPSVRAKREAKQKQKAATRKRVAGEGTKDEVRHRPFELKPSVPSPPPMVNSMAEGQESASKDNASDIINIDNGDGPDPLPYLESYGVSCYPIDYNPDVFPYCLLTATVAKAAGMTPYGPLPPTLGTLEQLLKSGGVTDSGVAVRDYAGFMEGVARADTIYLERVGRKVRALDPALDPALAETGRGTVNGNEATGEWGAVGTMHQPKQTASLLNIVRPYMVKGTGIIEDGGARGEENGRIDTAPAEEEGRLGNGNSGLALGKEMDMDGNWNIDLLSTRGQMDGSAPTPLVEARDARTSRVAAGCDSGSGTDSPFGKDLDIAEEWTVDSLFGEELGILGIGENGAVTAQPSKDASVDLECNETWMQDGEYCLSHAASHDKPVSTEQEERTPVEDDSLETALLAALSEEGIELDGLIAGWKGA